MIWRDLLLCTYIVMNVYFLFFIKFVPNTMMNNDISCLKLTETQMDINLALVNTLEYCNRFYWDILTNCQILWVEYRSREVHCRWLCRHHASCSVGGHRFHVERIPTILA